jgi:hypothetical protein
MQTKGTIHYTVTTLCVLYGAAAWAQYSPQAGANAITAPVTVETRSKDGHVSHHVEQRRVTDDKYGNAAGNQGDLAVDGAFEGQTVVVLHFYTGEGFDFSLPKKAIREKGFSVFRWVNAPPPPAELDKALQKACELWLISGSTQLLNEEHLKVIKKFFDAGHGVYIWGDNEPYYADANFVAQGLLGVTMSGNLLGSQVVGLQSQPNKHGMLPKHLLSTGIEHIFEGVTIATIANNQTLTPLIYGSADNLVTAFYDKGGKRAILDGGFTRLYINWDTAGTDRYVKNAAAWLANYERFGDSVVAEKFKHDVKRN